MDWGAVRFSPPPLPTASSPAPSYSPLTYLLQNVLDEADQKGAGLGVELVIPCREED